MVPKMDDLLKLGQLQENLYDELELFLTESLQLNDVYDYIFCYMKKNKLEVIPNSYPVSVNVNNIIYHGCEKEKTIKRNDLITIDTCFMLNSSLVDGAKTFSIGTDKHRDILKVSKDVVTKSIAKIKEGFKVAELLTFIHEYVSLNGFYLFPDGIGHGITDIIHARPFISLSFYDDYSYKFKKGDIFTIEPLVLLQKDSVAENENGEGIVSEGNMSSQFEVTILIDDGGLPLVINKGLIK